MNPVDAIKKNANYLLLIAAILIVGTFLTQNIPVLSFIALAPLFAMLDKPNAFRNSYRLLIIIPIIGLLSSFMTHENHILNNSLYAAGMLILFWVFAEVHLIRQNVLNKLALVIFMLGVEYLIIKFVPVNHGVFLADLLQQKPDWTRWNIYTGYLGTSLWILSTNLIFYQAIFKSDTINKGVLFMAILFVLLPILYSFSLSNQAITKMDMVTLYSGEALKNTYTRNGELISRTGAWVSILIVIFTFVKSKTKQKHK